MLQDVIKLWNERQSFFMELVIQHFMICLIAIIIGSVVGLFLGVIASENKKLAPFILALTNFSYTIPAISLLGLLLPITGIGNTTAIIALSIYALLPIVKATYAGINNINPKVIESAVAMGSTNRQVLFKIKLPLASPIIMSGFKSMVVMSIALAGIASFVGAGGLGVAIYRGITTNNMPMVLIGSILIAMMALISDLLISLLERNYLKYKKGFKLGAVLILIISIIFMLLNAFKQDKVIKIATKPMSEQLILGEMLKLIIEDKSDLKVVLTNGVAGGTSNIHPAMLKHEFDLYPEYTSSAWNFVLKNTDTYPNDELLEKIRKSYNDEFDLSWLGMYGFNNTYGLMIQKDLAEQYNINTYSDLFKYHDKFVLGAEYDFFELEDGYLGFKNKYHASFKATKDLDIGLKYQAFNNKQIDVMVIFTTDGQLNSSDGVVLEDDISYFKNYYIGNVVSNKILEENPELVDILNSLNDSISNEEMIEMNYLVDIKKESPAQVALDFLTKKKLIGGE